MVHQRVLAVWSAALAVCAGPAAAQSLHVENPSPLAAGVNQGSVDSFVGPHFWSFVAQPGRFHLVFAGSGTQEGFSIGGRAVAAIAFAPASKTSHFTVKESAQSTSFDGVVATPQKVVVEVEPRKSALVRQTTDYTLTLTGSVTSVASGGVPAGGPTSPPIAGVYIAKTSDAGAVRFAADGSLTASNGAHGTWTLFDEAARIYTVVLDGRRMTVTLSPGRGLVDPISHNIVFELQR